MTAADEELICELNAQIEKRQQEIRALGDDTAKQTPNDNDGEI